MLFNKKIAIYDPNKRVKWLYNMLYSQIIAI